MTRPKAKPKRKPPPKKPKGRSSDFKRTLKIAEDIMREYPETLTTLAGVKKHGTR
jgi:hypothetical protein